MHNKILGPLDGSKRAEKILPYVEELTFAWESMVTLLQVIEPVSFIVSTYDAAPLYTIEMAEPGTEGAKSYLTALANEFHREGLDVKTIVEHEARCADHFEFGRRSRRI